MRSSQPAKNTANPWINLPEAKPFVLPEDLKAVEDFNGNLRDESVFALRVEKILPEAFIGSADATVLLLSNNPGYKNEDSLDKRYDPGFMRKLRANLLHMPLPTGGIAPIRTNRL